MSTDETTRPAAGPPGPFDYAEYFGQISVLGDLLLDADERPWLTAIPAQPRQAEFVVWLGCNVLRTVHIVETLDDILEHIGVDYVMLGGPANCCGVQHARHAQADRGRRQAWNTFEKFEAFRPRRLLFWCPSCDHRLMDMGGDLSSLAAERQHVSEFFVQNLERFDFQAAARPQRVALHAHTGWDQQDQDAVAVRALLQAIPGVEVVDVPAMAELGFHCADPKIGQLPPGRFREMLDASIREAQAQGVDTLVTIYHACHRELIPPSLGMDAQEALGSIRIENYLTLLARGLGLPEHTDRYKRFVELGDADAIVAELEPRIAQLGLPAERARRFIAAQFCAPRH